MLWWLYWYKYALFIYLDSAEEEVALGADAATGCAKYSSSPTKTDSDHPYGPYYQDPTQTNPKNLFPTYSDEVDIRYSDNGHIDKKPSPSPPIPSPKPSPSHRKKSSSKKKAGGATNVPDTTNALSPPTPTGQSPNVRRKSRPKSAPKRSPPGGTTDPNKLQNTIVVDDYTTQDDYQLDDYSEEEIKLPDDAYTDDYEEDDEGQSSDTGGSLSPARAKVDKGGANLNAPNTQRRHKGGKERRKKRKDDTKVTWDD